ncbi:MAG: Hsp20/alpha crystallin family protein [Thiogranum sp.]|nr:Hsp20/alpha crystallin family protein [Thiogranum sp.]
MAQGGKKSQGKQNLQPAKAGGPAAGRSLAPFEDMERFMSEFFGRGWMQPWQWPRPDWSRLAAPFEGRMPKVDIIDRNDEILVRAELPGVDKKDVDVSMTDYTVTIKGETRKEAKEEKGDYYRSEMSSGMFSRTVTLPAEVDGARAKATFKDGILELTLPKIEESKRRSIKVE